MKKVVKTTSKAKTSNPKDILGSRRVSLTKIPPIALIHVADAMMDGATKYDPYNWRAKDITLLGYIDAAFRHILAYMEGENQASDSGAHHLGHAMATLAILLDAEAHGNLIDDRPKSDGGVALSTAIKLVTANIQIRALKKQLSSGPGYGSSPASHSVRSKKSKAQSNLPGGGSHNRNRNKSYSYPCQKEPCPY